MLPLSIPGAISMAHIPDSDSFLSGDEWFVFKFGEWTHHLEQGIWSRGFGAEDLEQGIWSRGFGAGDSEQGIRSRGSGAVCESRDGIQAGDVQGSRVRHSA